MSTDHKHVVCYSGGHTSAIVAIEVVRRFGRENVVLLNHDIVDRSEDADIKRFKREVADYLGLPITYANMDGWQDKDQFDVCVDASAFKVGNGTALCTNRLKTRPFERWLAAELPGKNATIHYGFDKVERLRIQRRMAHIEALGFKADFPAALWSERTIQSTSEVGIEPPRTYDVFKHANCVGCLKAGRQHWYVVHQTRPDVWAKAKRSEDEIGYTIIKGISLAELEPLFDRMKVAGIEPTEKVPAGRFWAEVRRTLAEAVEAEPDAIPCECAA